MISERKKYTESTFDKNIAWDYYDGPVSGVLQQKDVYLSYRYQVVAWDNWQDLRMFILGEIPNEVFEDFEESLVRLGLQPKYPVWFVDLSAESKEIEKQVSSICRLPFVPSAYVIAENLSQGLTLSKFDSEGTEIVEKMMPFDQVQGLDSWKILLKVG